MATQIGLPASPQAQAPVTLSSIIAQQEEIFARRQPESRRMADRAGHALAGGVTSSWQITRPQPVWLSHGKGSKIYDVDGNEYVDLHGGYGAALAGHGHPAIVDAVRDQVALGTHFAQPTRNAIIVAEELSRRFGLPQWRFANSGTEATMDAIHLMRAITGRERRRARMTGRPASGCWPGRRWPGCLMSMKRRRAGLTDWWRRCLIWRSASRCRRRPGTSREQ